MLEEGEERVQLRQRFRLARRIVQVGPFGFEEGEVRRLSVHA